MSDLEPERDEQPELVDDDIEAHQRASERARAKRDRDHDVKREAGQLDLDTAAATRRLDEFEGDEAYREPDG